MTKSVGKYVTCNPGDTPGVDEGALGRAYQTAAGSPDPSTQNGAVLWCPTGGSLVVACNDFPPGVDQTPKRWERPAKYQYVVHAEAGVIARAARDGCTTKGATMYCVWAACSSCAKLIVQSGITRLVVHYNPLGRRYGQDPHWVDEVTVGMDILREAGVEVSIYDQPIPGAQTIRYNGIIVEPSRYYD